ncbi:MAG TPA: hypothetical protein VEB64_10790 [Azospirillaceae bacterium]|nr:hypothetical protein [Azospirillaceae bacterium]
MQPATDALRQILNDMADSGNEDHVAYRDNYLLEERATPERQQRYEADFTPVEATCRAWKAGHERYLWQAIRREVPETFTAVNGAAAHSGCLDRAQYLVRLESLEYALREIGMDDAALLEEVRAVAQGERTDPKMSRQEAADLLQSVCDVLNTNPNAVSPRFAGFLGDVANDVGQPDWANRLRDRFGLAHYKPTSTVPAIPVVLMRYPVKAAFDAARGKAEAVHPICVPTVLDHAFSGIFFPSPHELAYGRTVDLADDAQCERKISEVLHLQVQYEPAYIFKVGAITASLPEIPLERLRAGHLFCLQYDSVRDDFGADLRGVR